MGNIEIGFQYPWYLLLLIAIPVTWWISRRSLSGLGPWRRSLAIVFRSLVLLLLIFAIAGVQWIWSSEKLTVIYLLDQSDSIPVAKRQLMLKYAIESVKSYRNKDRQDRAGLIIFGREASIEIPPLDENLPPISKAESYFGKTDATNLESALKLAQATFLEDSARRVVVITDGNQTLGSAEATAQRMAENGIGIDIVPIRLDTSTEVLVEKIDIPGYVRQGQTVEARVVVNRYSESGQERNVDGRLRVVRRIGNQTETVIDDKITLDRDTNVIPIPHQITETAGYNYEAEFTPDDLANDTITQNNRATAFTYARGKGRVMLIEDANKPGDYNNLIESLRRSEIDVDVRTTSNLFSSLVELQSYDCVILAGVPRTSGEDAGQIISFTDGQIDMLVQSAQQFGMGIVMLGGPEAFGAGGWTNTKLEEAMPVNFAIKNSKVQAVGALAMVMHASEIPEGNYWQKMIGKAALDALGPQDYCGVVQYDMSGDKWLWGDSTGMMKVGENKALMRSKMSRMQPGDMPTFDASLAMAIKSLKVTDASVKHMIVISDGDPTAASNSILSQYTAAQIKISTVAVGAHGPAGHGELKRIAQFTGGNYYVVTNASALPKIFMREARRVARPLVFEPKGGSLSPIVNKNHEILSGITEKLPPIRGFVLTERKDSPLVEVPLISPQPEEQETASILATWTYGLGRTAVFTTDTGVRWASDWVDSPYFDQFFSQLVRWTMRPTNDEGKYNLATVMKDGQVQIVVTALDDDDQYQNFLEMNVIAVGPDLKPQSVALRQQGPGRYVGELTPEQSGSYMLSLVPGEGKAPVTTGVNVPFSDEYRVRQANMKLLEQITDRKPTGGSKGILGPSLDNDTFADALKMNTYREGLPPSKSLKDIWPLAVLVGATLFFGDVFVRRVALDVGYPLRWLSTRLRRNKYQAADEQRQRSLDRLRSSKTTVVDDLDKRRMSVEYEPDLSSNVSANASETFGGQSSKPTQSSVDTTKKPSMQVEDEQSYTSRLLDAKRKAKKQ